MGVISLQQNHSWVKQITSSPLSSSDLLLSAEQQAALCLVKSQLLQYPLSLYGLGVFWGLMSWSMKAPKTLLWRLLRCLSAGHNCKKKVHSHVILPWIVESRHLCLRFQKEVWSECTADPAQGFSRLDLFNFTNNINRLFIWGGNFSNHCL